MGRRQPPAFLAAMCLALATLAHAGSTYVRMSVFLPQQDFGRLPVDAGLAVEAALRSLLVDGTQAPLGIITITKVGREGSGTVAWGRVVAPNAVAGGHVLERLQAKSFAATLASRLTEAQGLDVGGLDLPEPKLLTEEEEKVAEAEEAEAAEEKAWKPTLLHHILPGIAVVALLLLLVKKAHSQSQLGMLRERQRRRRTDMIDGVDGAELGRAYHADQYSIDSDSDDGGGGADAAGECNALLESPPPSPAQESRSSSVRRRSSG